MTRRERYWVHSDPDAPEPESEVCQVPHRRDPDRPRRTAPGSLLCRGCVEHLRDNIAAMPGLYDGLAGVIAGGSTGMAAGPISGGDGASGPSGRQIAAAAHQKQILFDLRAHVRWVTRERGLRGTSLTTPLALARWLEPHVDWMARQPEPENAVDTFRELRGRAYALIDPRPRTEFEIPGDDGRCPEAVDGQQCEGRLWVSGIQGAAASFEVSCTHCAKTWDSTQLMRLGVRIDRRRSEHNGLAAATVSQ